MKPGDIVVKEKGEWSVGDRGLLVDIYTNLAGNKLAQVLINDGRLVHWLADHLRVDNEETDNE
jgi:hypothetical protein